MSVIDEKEGVAASEIGVDALSDHVLGWQIKSSVYPGLLNVSRQETTRAASPFASLLLAAPNSPQRYVRRLAHGTFATR
jgi:hypothetical protein